jgi:hypothetical protein
MKILSIGDTHGRVNWKSFGDISELLLGNGIFVPDYDKYIFVGDYTDSFNKTSVEIFEALTEVIRFKILYPEYVILLLGNHDLQYYFQYKGFECTGFRPYNWFDLNELFNKHKDLFQVAYQYKNYIWTHAGISNQWYKHEFSYHSNNIATDLNTAFLERCNPLFDVGYLRGGFKPVGGIFWADKAETESDPLKGMHQIVGHTQTKEIIRCVKDENTSITYIDIINEPLILEI